MDSSVATGGSHRRQLSARRLPSAEDLRAASPALPVLVATLGLTIAVGAVRRLRIGSRSRR